MTTCGFKTFSLRSTFTLITVSYHKGTHYTLGKSLITSLTNGGVNSLITIKIPSTNMKQFQLTPVFPILTRNQCRKQIILLIGVILGGRKSLGNNWSEFPKTDFVYSKPSINIVLKIKLTLSQSSFLLV